MDDATRTHFVQKHERLIRMAAYRFKAGHRLSILDVDDYRQAARWRVWRAAHNYCKRKGSAESSWVYAVAWNAMVDEERSASPAAMAAHNRRRQVGANGNGFNYPTTLRLDESATALLVEERGYRGVDDREAVQRVLWFMASRDRRCAVMYYLHGMSMREVARAIGLSESRVCQILRRAREEVRQRFPELVAPGWNH